MKRLICFALLSLAFWSCQNQPESSLNQKIEKTWKLDSQTLSFNKDSSYVDTAHILATWTFGHWEIIDSSLILYSLPDSSQYKADSTIIQTDKTGTSIKHFKNGQLMFHSGNQLIAPGVNSKNLKIKSLSQNKLSLNINGKEKVFTVQKEELNTSFSFIGLLRGLLGIMSLLFIGWLLSTNRKAIDWPLILKGIAIQIVFALLILKVPIAADVFSVISSFFVQVIQFTQAGTDFLFKSYQTNEIEPSLLNFAFDVLPTIIFFSALTSIFYYLGFLQKVVYYMASFMKKFMNLSGAESMAAAGNIFLGQTESPLLVKPYLGSMTKSEMMCLMTGGMATIAGGVLAAYIGYLGGDDPNMQLYFARHLLAASLMSAPAAILFSKMLVPETENYNKKLEVPKSKVGSNILEAITNGTTDGLRLAINVGAMLLVFLALMAMANFILKDLIGEWTNLNTLIAGSTNFSGLTFEFLVGYGLSPVTWLLGVPGDDVFLVGELLGKKTIINEFVAYTDLGLMKANNAFTHDKSLIMATYILCGFANFASIGIQIGGIGALAPDRKPLLSQLGFRSLIGGTLACMMTAVIVGVIY